MPGLTGDEVAAQLPQDQCVFAWSTDLTDLPARFNGVLAKPLTADSAMKAMSVARARREEAQRVPQLQTYASLGRRP
jgi:hypothetical protein